MECDDHDSAASATLARPREFETTSPSARRTEAIGYCLGRLLRLGDVLCVSGDLGAGKTVLSRGIGAGWGATTPLTSPTYNLVHEHERAGDKARLFHLDLYRVSGLQDAESLSIDEILDCGGLVIFEWPERILDSLPAERLWIDIMMRADDGRDLLFEARGDGYISLLNALRRALAIRR
ncbi:MAG: tRNA (adenosine(37)-N6)-threonylcarbamoyltransferase complex ATPase subunit type 1 TsaE [Chloroflexi bacterium]|nr:tRNA (adenosine(37)-N6)-threonylcarbamoyltransferase complex ATPase subunit type 1 TsaE [Chloroflexota bacterium]